MCGKSIIIVRLCLNNNVSSQSGRFRKPFSNSLSLVSCCRLLGTFWKCARIGERLSPYVSVCCISMALYLVFWSSWDWAPNWDLLQYIPGPGLLHTCFIDPIHQCSQIYCNTDSCKSMEIRIYSIQSSYFFFLSLSLLHFSTKSLHTLSFFSFFISIFYYYYSLVLHYIFPFQIKVDYFGCQSWIL